MANPQDVVYVDPMFGPITQDQVDHPYTQPGTATPTINPTHPWWLGQNPETGQQPWEYAGSPGQAAWQAAQPPPTPPPVTTTPKFDPGTARSLLRQYGLEELAPMIDTWIADNLSLGQIEAMLFDRSSAAGQVVDKYYPELRLRQEKGLAPMTIDQIQGYRTTARQYFRAAGLPTGFYDENSDFTNFIANDVSLAELQSRVVKGYQAAASASPEMRHILKSYYGVDEGGLAAYYLDPTRAAPLLEQQQAAAQVGGSAMQHGLDVSRGTAERLQQLGVDSTSADSLFSKVATILPTLGELQQRFNDPTDPLTPDTLSTALVLNDPTQLQHIARLYAQENALFSGGNTVARDRSGGLIGLQQR